MYTFLSFNFSTTISQSDQLRACSDHAHCDRYPSLLILSHYRRPDRFHEEGCRPTPHSCLCHCHSRLLRSWNREQTSQKVIVCLHFPWLLEFIRSFSFKTVSKAKTDSNFSANRIIGLMSAAVTVYMGSYWVKYGKFMHAGLVACVSFAVCSMNIRRAF